ncbi:hypothetical protein WMY93_012783 [Mugilogobius chulae]|uniref:SRCR domain-containing protein n=1 Tax=Mugilogobius chulae TaxID=88201 RepID=A0AAW0P7A0_9GOBI
MFLIDRHNNVTRSHIYTATAQAPLTGFDKEKGRPLAVRARHRGCPCQKSELELGLDSVRLVSGPSLCSGSLQIQWNQSWTSVCEEDLDLQDAEVVCRQLGCGAPSLLQGALSEEDQVLLGQMFHCEGNESALMKCPSSSSGQCSSGTTVNLTCLEPVRLMGLYSRCAGVVEVKHEGEWRPIDLLDLIRLSDLKRSVCQDLGCGKTISEKKFRHGFTTIDVWRFPNDCEETYMSDCLRSVIDAPSFWVYRLFCSDLLHRPTLSLSVSADGDSEAQVQGLQVLLGSDFTIICSVKPQFPGGFFQLICPNQNLTLPAVNHSAHFLFSDAGPAHKGGYTCVYHQHVFNHSFSSQSLTLQLSLGASDAQLMVKVLIIVLLKLLYILSAVCCYCKATRVNQRN